jgi:hypothetical protein
MSTPESAVVRACLDYLQIIGVVAWRNNTTGIYDLERQTYRKNAGRNGIADIVGCLPGGRFLAVECKAGRGKLSPHQIEFQKDIIKAGGLHVVAYRLEDLIEAIQMKESPRL